MARREILGNRIAASTLTNPKEDLNVMSIASHDNLLLVEPVEINPIDGVDFFQRFSLPPLRRMTEEEERIHIDPLQVIQRLHALGLNETTLFIPERRWKQIYEDRRREQIALRPRSAPVGFRGAKVSELNRFLDGSGLPFVQVLSSELEADETLRVPSKTTLMGTRTALVVRHPLQAAIEVADGNEVLVKDFHISGQCRVGIFVKNGRSIALEGNTIEEIDGRPIVVLGRVVGLDLIGNTIRSNGRGGMFLKGNIGPGLIQDNRIEDNRCALNLAAGLLLTSRPVCDLNDPEGGDLPGEKLLRLQERLESPHDMVIRHNSSRRNLSSGLYCCGVHSVYIIDNDLADNDKEGICADYGTVGSYIRGNRILGNGNRRRQTDEDMRNDFVLHLGRMRDGSPKAKLPGLSIDNSAYNIIHENIVSGNFGGGVKTVRTGVRNLICHNVISDNNRGRNDLFHFNGVELGNATPDVIDIADLDFSPDHENLVFRNQIADSHHAGIFLAEGCYRNDLFDNCIFGTLVHSIECLSALPNSSINNISHATSRGIPLDMNRTPEPAAPRELAELAPAHQHLDPVPPQFETVYHPYARKILKVGRRVRSWYRSTRRSVTLAPRS